MGDPNDQDDQPNQCTPQDAWVQDPAVGVSPASFDQDDGGGGVTAVTSDGAPFSTAGTSPTSSQGPTAEDLARERERKRVEEYDKPIEFDPIGQAIPGLLVGGALGLVKGAVEVVGTVVGEGLVTGYDWVKEHVSSEPPSDEPPADPADAGVSGSGGQGPDGGTMPSPSDPSIDDPSGNQCVDPSSKSPPAE